MDQSRKESLTALFESISVLERKVANEWNSHNELGFSKSHIWILDFLANEGPMRPSAIADRLKVTTGGVTGLTAKLLKNGYIERTQSESDRRAAQISITEDGLEILEQSRRQIDKLANSLFGMLTEDEVDALHTILDKCLHN